MRSLWGDLRFALRMLGKNPSFAAVSILTLALGIGANTVIFSVVHIVLLTPLSYPNAQRLVSLTTRSFPKFVHVQEQSRSLAPLAAYYSTTVSLATQSEPEAIKAEHVSLDFFSTLGIQPSHGRSFLAAEDVPGGPNVAILSDAFWHNHFAASESAVGQSIVLDGVSTTIVGVLPGNFHFPFEFPEPEIWLPRVSEHPLLKPVQIRLGAGYLSVVGRLQPGQTLTTAQAELSTIDERYRSEFPTFADANKDSGTTVAYLADALVSEIRGSLVVLVAAVGLVLLIACANVASLLLARATAREKEIALRRTLGASRLRLVQQLLSESLLLSAFGGALGVSLALAFLPLLRSLGAGTVPRIAEVQMDAPVLVFSALVCIVTAILFGLAPAVQAGGKQLHDSLKEGIRGSSVGPKQGRVRGALVVAEIAVALVLMTGAALLAESFVHLLGVHLGFTPANVVTFPLNLPGNRYAQPQQQIQFYRELLERVRGVSAVEQAGLVSFLPLSGGYRQSYFCAEGQVCLGLGKDPLIAFWQLTPGYFEAMKTPLVAGRYFDARDAAGGAPVMIVNETAARHFWPGQNPLGKRVAGSRDATPRQVVGMVADVKFASVNAPGTDQFYVPLEQMPYATITLVVRSKQNPQALVSVIRQKLAETDPTLPVAEILNMDQVVSASIAQPRLILQFVAGFAGFALLLAAIGIYGVMAYLVSARKQEMGIRLSLGASPQQTLHLMLRSGLRLALLGVGAGVILSLFLTRLMASLLFGTHAADPLAFIGAAAVLVLVALLACYLPARRATLVDPIVVLRYEP
jgi:putative ABC transport system permease protein